MFVFAKIDAAQLTSVEMPEGKELKVTLIWKLESGEEISRSTITYKDFRRMAVDGLDLDGTKFESAQIEYGANYENIYAELERRHAYFAKFNYTKGDYEYPPEFPAFTKEELAVTREANEKYLHTAARHPLDRRAGRRGEQAELRWMVLIPQGRRVVTAAPTLPLR